MSMRNYGVADFGLVLSEKEIKEIAKVIFEDFSDEAWRGAKYEFIEVIIDTLGLTHISNFTGETSRLLDNGSVNWADTEEYDEDTIYYVPCSVYPSMFTAAYENMDALVQEFKDKIREFVPDDFDYRSRIHAIQGSYWG